MRDSSASDMDAFQGIQWHNIQELLRIVLQSELSSSQSIARRYREQATDFGKTLAFLQEIGVLKGGASGHLSLSISGDFEKVATSGDERSVQVHLLAHVLQSHTSFRKEVCNYVRGFKVTAGELVYCPDCHTRASKSFVRNFLMELGIVQYSTELDQYRLSPDYLELYIRIRDRCRRLSPSVLQGNIRDREAIGWAAEEMVLSYEKNRVGPDFAHLVDHVSLRNVAAGYDIRSLTLVGPGLTTPRYIEVKAVSGNALTFYWTANEIKMASLLGRGYYLYLLPATRQGQFCLERLRIVQNAHMAVLGPEAEWQTREDVICCSLKGQGLDWL
jgi:hypothetical protein